MGNITEQEEPDEDGEDVSEYQKEVPVLSIENAKFTWSDQVRPTLNIISLSIPRGSSINLSEFFLINVFLKMKVNINNKFMLYEYLKYLLHMLFWHALP